MPLKKSQQQELKKLGAHIKALRKSKGLTQKQLGNAIDMDFQNVYRLERGLRNASYLTLRDLAAGLGVSLSELLKALD